MPTSPIPEWSTNLAVNIPKDERALLGRLAFRLGKRSVGALIREFIAEGVAAKCEKSASDLRQIRRQYYGAALLVIFGLGMLASWTTRENLERQCRRCPRRGAYHFEECITIEAEEAAV